MTTAELAAQYGVALPETCKELNWQKETILCYYRDKFNNMIHLTTFEKVKLLGLNFYAYAPQFHEIAKLLPPILHYKYQTYFFSSSYSGISYNNDKRGIWVGDTPLFQAFNKEKSMSKDSNTYNYVQAYAELYLKLKKQNLL